MARQQLLDLNSATHPLVNIRDYVDLPEGRSWVNQAWSGDMVNAQYYMPKGQSASVIRYWSDPVHAPVNNDTIAILDGRGSIDDITNGVTHEFGAGDAVFVRSGIVHKVKVLTTQSNVPCSKGSRSLLSTRWSTSISVLRTRLCASRCIPVFGSTVVILRTRAG